jgi:hypothetical protein
LKSGRRRKGECPSNHYRGLSPRLSGVVFFRKTCAQNKQQTNDAKDGLLAAVASSKLHGRHELIDIPPINLVLGNAPEPPEGYEVVRIDVVVRLRRKRASTTLTSAELSA